MILTCLQKLIKNVGDLGKFIVAKCFELLPKVQKIAQSGHTELVLLSGVLYTSKTFGTESKVSLKKAAHFHTFTLFC